MSRFTLFTVAWVGLLAAGAQAVTFSFASDDNANGPTFMGPAVVTAESLEGNPPFVVPLNDVMDAGPLNADGTVFTFLAIDLDDDGPVDVFYTPAYFLFAGDFTSYMSTTIGGLTLHNYTIDGSFQFFDDVEENFGGGPFGNLLMEVTFTNAVFTSVGTTNNWGQTATIQGSQSGNSAVSINITPDLVVDDPSLGPLFGQPVVNLLQNPGNSEDFVFTLTNLRDLTGGLVNVSSLDGFVFEQWVSEGSWSAHEDAEFVPEPASAALLAMGVGLVALRRR